MTLPEAIASAYTPTGADVGSYVRAVAHHGTARPVARRGGGTRRQWGRGRCRCRTEGRNSSGTVRGTNWLTIDRQRKTITKVKRGKVRVRDFVADRTVIVRAGESYTAGPGGGGRD